MGWSAWMSGQAPRSWTTAPDRGRRRAPAVPPRRSRRRGHASRSGPQARVFSRRAPRPGRASRAGRLILFMLPLRALDGGAHDRARGDPPGHRLGQPGGVEHRARSVLRATILYEGAGITWAGARAPRARLRRGRDDPDPALPQAFLLSLGAIPFYALASARRLRLEAAPAASYLLCRPPSPHREGLLSHGPAALPGAGAPGLRGHGAAPSPRSARASPCASGSRGRWRSWARVYWLCVERRVRAGRTGGARRPVDADGELPPAPGADRPPDAPRPGPRRASSPISSPPLGRPGPWARRCRRAASAPARWAALLAAGARGVSLHRTDLRYVAPLFSIVWMAVADEVTHWERPVPARDARCDPRACSRWPTWRWARGGRPLLASGRPATSRACRRTPACAPSPACRAPRSASGSTSSIGALLSRTTRGVSMPSTPAESKRADPALVGRRAPPDRAEAFRAVEAQRRHRGRVRLVGALAPADSAGNGSARVALGDAPPARPSELHDELGEPPECDVRLPRRRGARCQPDCREALQDRDEGERRLQPRERRADAVVDAVAEREVLRRIPREID